MSSKHSFFLELGGETGTASASEVAAERLLGQASGTAAAVVIFSFKAQLESTGAGTAAETGTGTLAIALAEDTTRDESAPVIFTAGI